MRSLLRFFFLLLLQSSLILAKEIPTDTKPFYSWQQQAASVSLSGSIIAPKKDSNDPFILQLKVKHPAGFRLYIDTALTPFFLPQLRLEILEQSVLPQKEEEESTLRYALYPLQWDVQILQADLFCLPATSSLEEDHTMRLPLQFPAPPTGSIAQEPLVAPLILEPLPMTPQSEKILLSDLSSPVHIDSWQHNAVVIRQHGVPWGTLALLATGAILAWIAATAIKQWREKRVQVKLAPINPAEEALSQLDQLQRRQLVERKEFVAYYTSLIATLRWYLNTRFPQAQGDDAQLPTEVRQLKEDLVAYADPVKFGKKSSTPMDCRLAAAYVTQCVYLVEKEKAPPSNFKEKT